MTASHSSFASVTAVTSVKTEKIDINHILNAADHRGHSSYFKLAWQAAADTALFSKHLDELESDRQMLKQKLESFALLLAETQAKPPEGLAEDKFKQYLNNRENWESLCHKAQKDLHSLDQRITLLNDQNEFYQQNFRTVTAGFLKQIDAIHDDQMRIIVDFLKILLAGRLDSRDTSAVSDLQKTVKAVLNDPSLQEIFLQQANAGQTSQKSLSQKFKEWFK